MFNAILVALDGSATSNAGLKHAVQLASDQKARLVGLHVVDDSGIRMNFEGGYVPTAYIDKLLESLRHNGSVILGKAKAAAKEAGVELTTLLVESHGSTIADSIISAARKAKADIVVIGTHGRRGLSRFFMGSDAEAVLRQARVPVLLVRSPGGAQHSRGNGNRRSAASSAGKRSPRTPRSASLETVS